MPYFLTALCSLSLIVALAEGGRNLSDVLHQEASILPGSSESRKEEGKEEDKSLQDIARDLVSPEDEEQTVILVTADASYLDMLENWYLSVQRLGHSHRVIFVAEDEGAYRFLSRKWPKQTAFVNRNNNMGGSENESSWGSDRFNAIMDRRQEYMHSLLEINLTVVFSDIDMVWLKDPFPFFSQEYDLLVMDDGTNYKGFVDNFPDGKIGAPNVGAICGCFLVVRPTDAGRSIIRRWKDAVEERTKATGKPLSDQLVLNEVILMSMAEGTSPALRLGCLPVQHFPSGCIFFGGRRECNRDHDFFVNAVLAGGASAVVAHNNWIIGRENKVNRFKDTGLWLLEKGTHEQTAVQR